MLDALDTSVKLRSKTAIIVENIFSRGETLDNFPGRQRRAKCSLACSTGSVVVTPGALSHKPSATQVLGRRRTRALNIAIALLKGRNKLLNSLYIGTCVKRVILYLVKCCFKRRDGICKILARDKGR